MYKQISKKLLEAKEGKDKLLIKESILFFVKEIENVINSPDIFLRNKLFFSEFIEDRNFIFGVNDLSIFNEAKADINISTSGIIAELFNIYGVSDGENISNRLKDALFSLHSKLSRDIIENDADINALHIIFEDIKQKFV